MTIPTDDPYRLFASLAGSWTGRARTWFDPQGAPSEAPVQGSIQLVLGGRFAIYMYESQVAGQPQQGMFILGYNTGLERFEASWVDNIHNGAAIMFCTGAGTPGGFQLLGSYPDPEGGPDWGWRTEFESTQAGGLTISAYNILPDGSGEALAILTELARPAAH